MRGRRSAGDQAEMQRVYQEQLARRAEFYREYPEVERFEWTKRRLLKIFLLSCLGLTLGKLVMLRMMNGTGLPVLLLALVMGFGMNAIFLAAGMGTKWKLALVLYGWVAYNLIRFAGSLAGQGIGSLGELAEIYAAMFSYFPLAACLDLLSLVFTAAVLLTAMWLTLIPGNRRLAEESDRLCEQWKAYIASNQVEKSK